MFLLDSKPANSQKYKLVQAGISCQNPVWLTKLTVSRSPVHGVSVGHNILEIPQPAPVKLNAGHYSTSNPPWPSLNKCTAKLRFCVLHPCSHANFAAGGEFILVPAQLRSSISLLSQPILFQRRDRIACRRKPCQRVPPSAVAVFKLEGLRSPQHQR